MSNALAAQKFELKEDQSMVPLTLCLANAFFDIGWGINNSHLDRSFSSMNILECVCLVVLSVLFETKNPPTLAPKTYVITVEKSAPLKITNLRK